MEQIKSKLLRKKIDLNQKTICIMKEVKFKIIAS